MVEELDMSKGHWCSDTDWKNLEW